jgi:hypothetical protein
VNRLLLAAGAAFVLAGSARAQFTVGFTIGCHHGTAVPSAPFVPYAPYTPFAAPVAPFVPFAPYYAAPNPVVPSPINPSSTGTPPGTGGPPPVTTNCDLISAIKDLTKEVREFKEAYKQVNKDKLQKVSLDRFPELDASLARLRAAQSGNTAAADPQSGVDRQLAVLKQAQAGPPARPTTAVATR